MLDGRVLRSTVETGERPSGQKHRDAWTRLGDRADAPRRTWSGEAQYFVCLGWPSSTIAVERILVSCSALYSSDGLQVGLHHSGDPAHFSSLPQLIHCGLALPIAITESLKGHVKPNLVPIFEAVGNCLCGIENPDGDAFHFLGYHSIVEGRPRKAHDSQRRIIYSRPTGFLGDGQPHLMRHLSRKIVKAQCRDQADDPVRHSLRGFRQTMMLRRLCISRNVETTSHSRYQTSICGEPQVLARYSSAIQVARSKDTRPTNHPDHKFGL